MMPWYDLWAMYIACGCTVLMFVHLFVSQVWQFAFNQGMAMVYAGLGGIASLFLLWTMP
jgi:hypothetical protein